MKNITCYKAEHICNNMTTSFSHSGYLHGKPDYNLSLLAEHEKGSGQQVNCVVCTQKHQAKTLISQ